MQPAPTSDPASEDSTLVGILRWRAARQPDRIAYTFLADGQSAAISLTYAQLDRRARALGARLQQLHAPGERALLLYPPGLEYIVGLFGCLYAGVVAVPVYPPRRSRLDPRLSAIAADSQAALALTIGSFRSAMPALAALQWLATDDLSEADADDWQEHVAPGDTLALLQYTSGSTAEPKGVMVSHSNLLHNLAAIQQALELTPADRGVSWLPAYHDMGLIGAIWQPLYTGFPITLLSPVDFLQRPLRWLQAIAHIQATISGGPNFAYDLCVRRVAAEQRRLLDLSSWRVAFNGAEPIRQETLDQFALAFAACGFRRAALYPCYGLAEATLFVSGGSPASLPVAQPGAHARPPVSCGQPWPGQKIAIVDPESLAELPPGQTGEIWVASPSVAQGYWNRPEEMAHSFRAALAGSGADPFLRTGDLGFVQAGQLFVSGRLKDLIIIRGRNHYPHDIELTVARSHPALRPDHGAAFAAPLEAEERLVIVHELARPHRHADGAAVVRAIRQALAEQHDLQAHAVVLLKPGSLPRTSSGKIQRYLCREKFLSGSLEVLYTWTSQADPQGGAADQPGARGAPTAEVIQAWLVARIAEQLGIAGDQIDVREPFAGYGLDSLAAVSISGELEQRLGCQLSPTLAWEHPSIAALARHLAESPSSVVRSQLHQAWDNKRPTTDNGRQTAHEPIAIVGVACRFPGAPNPDAFWRLLCAGVDAISEVPADRWDVGTFYDPDPSVPGKMNTRWGGFLDRVDQFDAQFFGISPREAVRMDPQQRLLLELSWEVLEDAGLPPEQLSGSRTGVFIGLLSNDYGGFQADPNLADMYMGSGNAASIASNRISYVLNLRGPSMTVDTACSSSLVALHLACSSIWNGEADLALAGGANLLLMPTITIGFSKAGMMSPDGRCKAFDAQANGYVRSDGAGLVALKPLAKALADGDPIYAVIRGSAVNQDGRSNGLTAPNPEAQTAVILEACRRAGVSPSQIAYVEAHGTGTALGDPIEAKALGDALAAGRGPGQRCLMGSVKTNIGHLEAAAGIAGLIKAALMLKHRHIPPSLHFHEPSPYIPFDQLALEVVQTLTPWPQIPGPALAGVNSFGFGGTNAHVVLEAAPHSPTSALDLPADGAQLVPLSARSPQALRALALAYRGHLAASADGVALRDIGYSAGARRGHHDQRLALVAHSCEELIAGLDAFLSGEPPAGAAQGHTRADRLPKLAFVFPGQGSQVWGMGRELFEQEHVFRVTIERCDQLFREYGGWSLIQELMAGEAHSRLDETEIAQPMIFALQVALAALWRSWGVVPDAVVGHSVGEVAAAHVAGALRLEDAVRVIVHRSRLMGRAAGQGQMAAVELAATEAQQTLAEYGGRLALAAINGPTSTVVSGDSAAVAELLLALEQRGVFGRLLPVRYAFHSSHMDPFCAELEQVLAGLQPRPTRVPMISTVSGGPSDSRSFDAAYWVQNMREPVLFAAAIDELAQAGCDIFLELSAQPVLAGSIAQCLLDRDEALALPSLRRTQAERAMMLRSLGALYSRGYPVDWRRLYPAGARFVQLPAYPWQRERYWLDDAEMSAAWKTPGRAAGHPLLGQRLHSAHPAWQSELDTRRLAYLDDHRIQGLVLLPGTAYTELALAAAAEVFGSGPHALAELEFHAPLFLPQGLAQTIQVALSPEAHGEAPIHIYNRTDAAGDAWTLHMSATIRPQAGSAARAAVPIVPEQLRIRCPEELSGRDFYDQLEEKGFHYGPCFQGIAQLWRGAGEAWALIHVPQAIEQELDRYHIHPAIMDACGQVLLALAGQAGETFVPVSAERIMVYRPACPSMWSHARLRPAAGSNAEIVEGDGELLDEAGHILAEVQGIRLQRVEYGAQPANHHSSWLYTIEWQPQAPPEPRPPTAAHHASWLIFADGGGTGAALAELLGAQAERCVLVSAGAGFARLGDDRFCIDWAQPDDMARLLDAVLAADQPALRGVVHLWGLDAPPIESLPADAVARAPVPSLVSVLHLVQALSRSGWAEAPRLWLITRGAQALGQAPEPIAIIPTTLWGLGRSILYEHPEYRCANLDLDPAGPPGEVEALFQQIWAHGSPENQIALRGQTCYAARLVRFAPKAPQEDAPEASPGEQRLVVPTGQPFRLATARPGLIDNLLLQPAARRPPGPGEVEIQVYAAGLNFRDVMKALGMYPGGAGELMWLGDECVGRVVALGEGVEGLQAGDEVIAVAPACFSSYTTTRAAFVVPRPAELSVEAAATIPIAFLTAYYALHHLGRLSRGERVLIHAAAGGVGLAAVQVAQWLGAEIFATAGSPEKREFLCSLGVQHVMDSRSLAFADEVMACTGGQGVDMVLNSLAGDALRKSLSTLGAYGRFLEIGKRDIYQNSRLGLRPFQNDLAFFSIDMARLFRDRPNVAGGLLREVIEHFQKRDFTPIPAQVFPIAEAAQAFRHMAQARHTGKIVLSMPDTAAVATAPRAWTLFCPDHSYLITGGLGGLGLLLAQWMVQQGARHLVLMGRSGASPEAAEAVERLKLAGAWVSIARADVAEAAQVAGVLADIEQTMPPLKGIFHAAGVMDNDILLQLNRERFEPVLRPKIAGAWNLHQQTLHLALDCFVLFSSAASLLGSPRQGNYAAANAALDALAHHRRMHGMPIVSVNWGPWRGLGMATHFDRDRRLALRGIGSIPAHAGLEILEQLLRQGMTGDRPVEVGVMPINWARWRRFYPAVDLFPLFATFVRQAEAQTPAGTGKRVRETLLAVEPNQRQQWLETYLQQQIGRVMQLPPAQLGLQQPLNTLGMDSLMGIELKNRVEGDLAVVFPIASLLQGPSIEQIATDLLRLISRKT